MHAHGDLVERARFPVVVHVLLLRDGEVFLLRRAATGFLDGHFAPPGGYQELGESVTDAARRECLEETGAEPAELRPVAVFTWRSESDQGLNFIFAADGGDTSPHLAEPERFDTAGWFAIDALPRPHASWLATALSLRDSVDWLLEFEVT